MQNPDVHRIDPRTRGVTLDLQAAETVNTREWQAALRDLHRMGMDSRVDHHVPVPRASVQAAPNVPPGVPGMEAFALPPEAEKYRELIQRELGMGDLHTQVTSPGERYWEQWSMGRRPVAGWKRGAGPGGRKPSDEAQFVQPVTWLAPPITSIAIDTFTPAAGVTLAGAYPGPGACVDVISIDVPDRFIVVLDRFGNELEDHDSFGDVRFSMMRNETPIRSYGDFDVQLGRFDDPTKFGAPIILKHKDEFRLKAQALGGTDHVAFARIIGWAFAVKQTSGDGSHEQYIVR